MSETQKGFRKLGDRPLPMTLDEALASGAAYKRGLLRAAEIIETDEAPYFGEDTAKTLRNIAKRLRAEAGAERTEDE